MKQTISNVEFRRSFGEFLDQVRTTKKPICITQHGVPWVILRHPGAVVPEDADHERALDVRYRLSEYINSVHYQQRSLVITRRNKRVACLCPPSEGQ